VRRRVLEVRWCWVTRGRGLLSTSWESQSMRRRGRRKGHGRIMGKRWIRVKVGGEHGRRMWKGLLSAVWVGGWVSRICGSKEGGRAIVDGIKAFGGELVDGRRRRSGRGSLSGWEYRRDEYRMK